MRIEYDGHARLKMTARQITEAEVEETFANPARVWQAGEGWWKTLGTTKAGRRLIAVWRSKPGHVRYVKTVYSPDENN